MKSSNKGVGKNSPAHIAEQDALPPTIFQPRSSSDKSGSYWQVPSDPADPTPPDSMRSAEDDFRSFIKSRIVPTKAPIHLLQKIRQSIHQLELKD